MRYLCRSYVPITVSIIGLLLVAPDLSGQERRGRPTVMVDGREAVDGEVLVRFHSTVGTFEKARAEAEVEASDVEPVGRQGTRRMRARRLGTHAMLARLRANPDVEFVEPNYIIRLAATPTDPSFGDLWGLFNVGQSNGTTGIAGADIDATLAWDVSTGTRDTVVGIVDTGIDYTHPDLAENIWTAPSAFSVTVGGVVINCAAGTHGFNAITNTCDPMDDHNHGTHVAGIVGAVGNNAVGVTGVNWTASMMALKFLESDGSGTMANAIKAIEFAVQAKQALGAAANVRVLSASWGGSYSQALLDEINRADASDMLVVAAAGNDAVNTDVSPTYPAAFSAPNIISVAATDNRDLRASFSNYGAATVHLGAPGVNILSTIRNNEYAAFSGTSVAAPHVSGAAALLLSTCTFSTASLKAALLDAVDPIASMLGSTTTGGRLNVNNAIRVCPSIDDGTPVNILVATLTPAAATVAPGSTMTFTLAGGPGHVLDWVGLYCPASGADSAYLDWKYLSNSKTAPATGLTAATITFAAPAAGTTCDARLFGSGGLSKLATSATVAVTALPTVTPTSQTVAASSTMTFTVAGGPGNVVDWVALYCPASGADSAYIDWKYLSNSRTAPPTGLTAATITFAAPAEATTCNARLFASGGIVKLATSATVTVTPLPTVTPTSQTVVTSSTMTFAVAGGPGNVLDWVALYCPASGADSAYADWKYLSNSRTAPATGLTAATITFTAPAAATTCNARLFDNGGMPKLATSATVTVTGSATPTVTPTSQTVAASSTMTFAVAGGPGSVVDWVALYCPTSGADSAYLDWKYLSNTRTAPPTGLTAATITFAAPAAATTCNVRLFASGGMSKLATSATVTVTGPSTATVTPTSQSVAASSTMTFVVAGGPGNVVDWMGLYCPTTGADNAYLDWKYLSNSRTAPASGLTAATITFAAPAAATTCNARLFASGGLSKLATSATVTVTGPAPLVLSPEDTSLKLSTNNHSVDAELTTYTWPDNQTANAILMKFDLSSVPPNAVVQEARLFLSLTQSDALPAATYGIAASKVLTHNPVISQATGYTADGVTAWTPNSCCHDGVPLAQADLSAPHDTVLVDKAPGFKSWNITTMVQEWLGDPLANFGLLLGSDTSKSSDHYRYFASMENPNSSLRPYLQVLYSISDDATPPAVSAVTATGVTQNAATINWTTNEAASSQVEYGLTAAYGSMTALNGALVTAHSMTLSGLSGGTQYHYRVRSRDQAGNLALSSNFTFTTLDGTLPSVSVTAPAAGATVSGTVSVTATASDNVGVVGVQFRLDGANLGAEDTTSPYSTSWNTTTAADGNHTLTAVARDAAGNVRTATAVSVTVNNAPPPPPPPGAGIAAQYPGDVGIENDPNVILVERFDESSLATLFGRWTDALDGGAMSFSNDAPAGSPVGRSLNIAYASGNTGGHLYRQLSQGVDDTLYVRYYIKHPAANNYQHTGVWMGGYNPPLAWPNPQAGTRPTGSDRFSASAEQNDFNFDHYNYWMGMRQSNDGNYWGNHLLNDPNVQAAGDQWMCVEQMVKLNTPVTASNGEHAIWINGTKVSHLGPGYPNGTWSGGIFTQNPSGTPFQGFQWRNTASLNLNWIWLQVYSTSGAGTFKYAHVVAATSYIGCLASGGGPPDTTLPTVALSAPAAAATVSGTVNVTANASDNIGVAGVQFRLDGVNLGAEDTTAPYSVSWNTTSASNGLHTLTAVARDAAGNSSTSTPVIVTVSNIAPPPSALWPNEPSGFTVTEETGWESGTLGAWYRIFQSSDKPINVTSIANSIIGESRTLQIDFPAGHEGGGGTELRYDIASANRRDEIYVGYYVQVNPLWQGHDSGINKMVYLHDGGSQFGAMWYEMFGSDASPLGMYVVNQSGSSPSGIHENVNAITFTRGVWHRVEIYQRQGDSNNGIVRVWVNGILAIDRSDVDTRSTPVDNITISGIWGGVGDSKNQADYMRFDRIRISRPGS